VAAGWTLLGVSRGGKPLPDNVLELSTADLDDVVLTFSNKVLRVSGTVTDPDTDVIVFSADTTGWREGIFNSRRIWRAHTGSSGTFEHSGLAPGEYYVAAVSTRLTTDWRDPQFLERLIPGAVKVTLGDGDDKVVALKTFTPKGR